MKYSKNYMHIYPTKSFFPFRCTKFDIVFGLIYLLQLPASGLRHMGASYLQNIECKNYTLLLNTSPSP